MSPGKGTPPKAFRVDPELWESAKAEAERRGETLSDVLRRALEEYLRASSDPK